MNNSKSALIGYTGFVGSNILNQHPFDFLYNSKNIEYIKNKNFDLVVCAGASGTKWKANQNPEEDLANIQRLIENLKKIRAKNFVLISTIDVYSPVDKVNEDNKINKDTLSPYGKHRRLLEEFIESRFEHLIIRLPGLYGMGLKKNPIYDLIHGTFNKSSYQNGTFQFYYLNYLWSDIVKSMKNDLKLINFATEPISIKEIAEKVFHLAFEGSANNLAVNDYDMHTKYGSLWGNTEPYLYLKEQVLNDLKLFASRSI